MTKLKKTKQPLFSRNRLSLVFRLFDVGSETQSDVSNVQGLVHKLARNNNAVVHFQRHRFPDHCNVDWGFLDQEGNLRGQEGYRRGQEGNLSTLR